MRLALILGGVWIGGNIAFLAGMWMAVRFERFERHINNQHEEWQ